MSYPLKIIKDFQTIVNLWKLRKIIAFIRLLSDLFFFKFRTNISYQLRLVYFKKKNLLYIVKRIKLHSSRIKYEIHFSSSKHTDSPIFFFNSKQIFNVLWNNEPSFPSSRYPFTTFVYYTYTRFLLFSSIQPWRLNAIF